jgi:hypothetical protein
MTPAQHRAFLDGVICALAVVEAHGQDTIHREIAESVGTAELFAHGRRTGVMKWSGLGRLRKSLRSSTFAKGEK